MIKIDEERQRELEVDNLSINHNAELYASERLNQLIQGNFILGKKPPYPDLVKEGESVGFEIVRCDYGCDLELTYILKAFNEANGDMRVYKTFISKYEKCNNLQELQHNYEVKISNDSILISKKIDAPVYNRDKLYNLAKLRIEEKVRKLNRGNYSKCKCVSLVMLSMFRHKEKDEINCIFKIFSDSNSNKELMFNNLYLITGQNIYYFQNGNICDFDLETLTSSVI